MKSILAIAVLFTSFSALAYPRDRIEFTCHGGNQRKAIYVLNDRTIIIKDKSTGLYKSYPTYLIRHKLGGDYYMTYDSSRYLVIRIKDARILDRSGHTVAKCKSM